MGAKRKHPDELKSAISVSLSQKLQKLIDEQLEIEEVTRSEWIVDAILKKLGLS